MSRAGTIDGPRFAVGREVVAGVLEIGDLPRLAESGCAAASMRFSLRGDADARATLTIKVAGRLVLTCQRCLGALTFPVAVASVLELAGSQAEIDAAEDERDRVLASAAMDVAVLVEDEVILAVPMVPMHAQCEGAVAAPRREEASPFAVLAGVKQGAAGPPGPRRKRNP